MENRLEVRTLLTTLREMGSRAIMPLLVYVAAITALETITDLAGKSSPLTLLNLAVTTVSGYLLLRAILLSTGLAVDGNVAGFGSYFGLSILEGLGMIAGFLLLIVPGIILMVRWSAAAPCLLCEGSGVSEALGRSFERTKGNFWPIFGAGLLGSLPVLAGALVLGGLVGFAKAFGAGDAADAGVSFITNGLSTIASAYFVLLSASVYKLLFRPHEGLSEVFA